MFWICNQIRDFGNQIAIIINDNEYTYFQLYNKIEEYKIKLNSIIPKEKNIIAIISDYNFESIAVFFALVENKCIVVPITSKIETEINYRIKESNCNYFIKFCDDAIEIKPTDFEIKNHILVENLRLSNSSGLILFSSGTTGLPKAMIHNLDTLIDSFKSKKGKNLKFLIFLMFDHIGGLNTMLNCISMGVTMVFPSSREPDYICSIIEKYSINVLPASPTFLNLVYISEAYLKYNMTSLRLVTYGTEPMPDSLLIKLKEIFPTAKFLQTFGTSETGIAKVSSKSSDSTLLKFDDPNSEFKIVDGELWIKSNTQIIGYLNFSMDRFTTDGWFKTGDLVQQTEDGYLKIIGRNHDIINVGGEKVLPAEVESLLFCMPEVVDCIVYGEKNPITGQMVVAKILFHDSDALTLSEAKKKVTLFCRGKIENYKIPAKIILMNKSEFSERFKKIR